MQIQLTTQEANELIRLMVEAMKKETTIELSLKNSENCLYFVKKLQEAAKEESDKEKANGIKKDI